MAVPPFLTLMLPKVSPFQLTNRAVKNIASSEEALIISELLTFSELAVAKPDDWAGDPHPVSETEKTPTRSAAIVFKAFFMV